MNKAKFLLVAVSFVLALTFTFSCSTSYDDPPESSSGGNNSGGGNSSGSGGGGTQSVIKNIKIANNTSQWISYYYIKPSTSTNWGSSSYISLDAGNSKEITFSQALSANTAYDIRLEASGYTFRKYGVTLSNGMVLTFTNADLDDESNLPQITIQNRSGVDFNSFYIRPSSMLETSSDWGMDYGSLSNNNDKSISIPIPASNYTVFDIQMRTTDPAVSATYTKSSVTVTNGMIVNILSTDSDTGNTGLPVIVIQNNTSQWISYYYIKPSTSTDWGSSPYISLDAGNSKAIKLPNSLSTNSVYDIRLEASGNTFRKYGVSVSDGMILTFTNSDLDDESNLPQITIQNRSGVDFNSFYIKPLSASDWGKDYGSLSNNNDKPISIPIPSSNYTVFDIQMRTTDPTASATYTKSSVIVTNGMTVTILSTDSDMGNTGLPVIVIQNNTSQWISYCYIKPSASTDWGSSSYISLDAGKSRAIKLPSTNSVYDIRLEASGYRFIKSGISTSDGMTVTFTNSDLQQ